jgi:glycosyltransferase involved in cell wall biosynthesis
MKVAAVFWGPQAGQGGTHTFAQDILEAVQEAAAQSQHEFVYYVIGGPPGSSDMLTIPYTRRERYRRAAIYRLRDMLDHAGMPRRRLHTWLERSLAEEGVDLVWFATNYVEQCDQPYVLTIFDVEHVRQPWFPEVSADGEWERRHHHYSRFLPKATRVVVPNAAGRDQIVRHFGIDPERVLCLPHPTPAFAREAARREPLPRERVERLGLSAPYVFYPAQFWAHKNHATLFDAVAELARDGGERYELVLTGSDKGQLAHVRSLVHEVGIADLVHFLGFVDNDDLVALYQHAHALTYLSFFGPENLPPLEAFALGCPVVAADVPGAREQLGDAALLVAPTDPAEIAGAVRKLEDQALRKELIERGRRRAEERTPAGYVDGVLRFLDEFERTRRCWGANASVRTE